MDTKWTKFKFSKFNKVLCALLGCLMAALCGFNGIGALVRVELYGLQALTGDNTRTVDSTIFKENFASDIQKIIDDVSHNENQATYDAAKASAAQRGLEVYKILTAYAKTAATETTTTLQSDSGGDESVTQITAPSDEQLRSSLSQYGVSDYGFEDGKVFFQLPVRELPESELSVSLSGGLTDDNAKSQIARKFGNNFYRYYCNDTNEAGESDSLALKNIQYYAVYDDGSVASNIADPQAFLSNMENRAVNDYYIIENGKAESDILDVSSDSSLSIYGYSGYDQTLSKVKLYAQIDTSFSADDTYGTLNNAIEAATNHTGDYCVYYFAASAAACIIFFVISIRLAGRKSPSKAEAEAETAFTDKIPADLHFAFAAAIEALTFWLIISVGSGVFYGSVNNLYKIFRVISSNYGFLYLVGIVIYLPLLELFTSYARMAKSGINIWKSTLIYKFGNFIKRITKRSIKVISAFAYKPQEMKKNTILLITGFVVLNLFGIALVAVLFALNSGIFIFLALILTACLLAADIYGAYKASKYMGELDKIIACATAGAPVEVDLQSLPQSLKILADSLDKQSCALQSAVIKAVKDERTKTELITNVSHDLKTPLTSVINYIDLLQKCDIKDEAAQKYMAVIADKANRLKKLIEDLIEASKVSSGNIVLNKALLDLNELATQAIVEETTGFEKANLQLVFEEPARKNIVSADGAKLYRVLENLLSNARKYSAPCSRVYTRVYTENDFGCFEIKNISKQALNISAAELTERFVRGDKSRNTDGHGLGLSIASDLCRLHGGSLDIVIDGDLFKATVKIPAGKLKSEQTTA